MREFFRLCFILCCCITPAASCGADDAAQIKESSGLAMVGQPELSGDMTHFPYANPDAPKGGVLRQAAIGTFDTINPFSLQGKAAQGLNLIYDRLMIQSWDEPFTLYPLLAEKVIVPDDRSSITFILNPKARFSDGSPVTTDDVLFSFTTFREKGRPNMRNVYKLVADTIVDKDARTITFKLGEGYNRETVMILAKMPVLPKSWWQDKDFNKTLLEPPVTSGPYRIATIDVGRRVVFERNPDYWGRDLPVYRGLNNFDRVLYDYFRDQTAAFESFKKGDLDIFTDLDPGHWAKAYKDSPAVQSGLIRKESLTHGRVEKMWGFIFNLRRKPFDDIKVRRALGLMLDYDWINRNNFYGQYQPLGSYFPNSDLAASGAPSADELKILEPYRSDLPPEVFGAAWEPPQSGSQTAMRQNFVLADKLLREAGWVVKDNIRINSKSGEQLRFEILIGSAGDEKIALAFKRNLARLGVNVTLRTLDAAAFQDRLMNYDYDMTLYWWLNTLSPGTEQALYWGCAAAEQKGRFNYSGICHPAVEKLIADIPNATSREGMRAHIRALDRILTWESIAIPLFYSGKDNVAAWQTLRHPDKTPLYGNVIEAWWADLPQKLPQDSAKQAAKQD